MNAETVLVTGVSGFIAKHCAIELLQAGYAVRGTVRSLARADEVKATIGRYADTSRLAFAQADLESDAGWREAIAGCADVLHIASPFPAVQPRDEQDVIRPAVQGTLRVLRLAAEAGVRRFVQTSSMVAVMYGHPRSRTAPFTEADWSVLDAPGLSAYAKSKTLAERAGREFAGREGTRMHYSTVNPGLVLGPALDRDIGTSAGIVQMFLKGKYPGVPRLKIPCVDVRDVARMHRLALEADAPSGARYLGSAGTLSMLEIGNALHAGLGAAARKVPRRELPDWLVKVVSLVDGTARQAVPDLGKDFDVDTSLTRRLLGLEFIPAPESAVALARSLIDLQLV